MKRYFYIFHLTAGILLLLAADKFLLFLMLASLFVGFGVVWASIITFVTVYFTPERKSMVIWLKTWIYMNISVHWIMPLLIFKDVQHFFK